MDFIDEKLLKSAKNAVSRGNVELLGELLMANKTHVFCNKVLYYAIVNGLKGNALDDEKCIEIIKTILNFGADVESVDRFDCYYILNDVITSGRSKVVKFFLDHGADVNAKSRGRTALMIAVENWSYRKSFEAKMEIEKIVELLLDRGAEKESRALSTAIASQRTNIVKLMLQKGFDANCTLQNKTALTWAIKKGNMDIVKLLLEHGARVNYARFEYGSTALHYAVEKGSEELVKLLLSYGAARDNSALYDAILARNTKVMKLLLENGFDANFIYLSKSMLQWAACNMIDEIVKLLLEHGARIDEGKSRGEKTALHYAAKYGDTVMTTTLLNAGADINAEHEKKTPVTLAIGRGRYSYMEVGKLLIRQMMLLRSQDLFVSEVNLNASKGNKQLEDFQNACASELKMLKAKKFDDSNLYYSDILKIKDDCKLAALANNENIARVMISEGFGLKFPIYGEMIIERFNKASVRREGIWI